MKNALFVAIALVASALPSFAKYNQHDPNGFYVPVADRNYKASVSFNHSNGVWSVTSQEEGSKHYKTFEDAQHAYINARGYGYLSDKHVRRIRTIQRRAAEERRKEREAKEAKERRERELLRWQVEQDVKAQQETERLIREAQQEETIRRMREEETINLLRDIRNELYNRW